SEQDWPNWSSSSWKDQEQAVDGGHWSEGDWTRQGQEAEAWQGQEADTKQKKPGTGTRNDWSHKKRQLDFLHGKDMNALKLQYEKQMTEMQQRHDDALQQKQQDLDTIDTAFKEYAYNYAKTQCQLDMLLDRETKHQDEIAELETQVNDAYEELRTKNAEHESFKKHFEK
ncbi:unnamed protein product, partial [Symbiodinium sp. CCMP2456]